MMMMMMTGVVMKLMVDTMPLRGVGCAPIDDIRVSY